MINEFRFAYNPHGCTIDSSCGSRVIYAYGEKSFYFPLASLKRNILNRVYSTQKEPLIYEYPSTPKMLDLNLVTKTESPSGRFMEVIYDQKQKVEALKEPVGTHGEAVATYRFQYEKESTQVKDAHGQATAYNFDKKQRLSSIRYLENNQAVRQDAFEWSPHGWLQKKSILKGDQVHSSTTYDYDQKGNVIRKTLHGNLTGDSTSYGIEYSYSPDNFNLLLSKKTPGRLARLRMRICPAPIFALKSCTIIKEKSRKGFFASTM